MEKWSVIMPILVLIIGFFAGYVYQQHVEEKEYLRENIEKGESSKAALLLFQDYNPETAIEEARRYLKESPNDYHTHLILGWAHHFMQQDETAISYFEKAIDLNPSQASPYEGLGASYLALKDFEKAIQFYHLALSKGDTTQLETIYSGLGWSYYFLGKHKTALTEFNLTAKFPIQTLSRQVGMALTYYKLGKKEEALALLNTLDEQLVSTWLPPPPLYEEYVNCMGGTYTLENLEECGPLIAG